MAVLAILACFGADEASADPYRVYGVEVDVTADNALTARELAIAEAHRRAWQALMYKLVPVGTGGHLQLGSDEISNLVADFSVEEEKTSAVRYLARMSFRFNAAAVRPLLRQQGIAFAEAEARPLLVVPVYEAGDQALLFRDDNPWRAAWARVAPDRGLVPYALPLGDLADVTSLTVEQAIGGEERALLDLAARYGARGALVAEASVSGSPEAGSADVSALARIYQPGDAPQSYSVNLTQEAGESFGDLLSRVRDRLDFEIQEDWKLANLLEFGRQQSVVALVPYDGQREWLEIGRRLDAIPAIAEWRTLYMSKTTAELGITFYGDEDQFARLLAQQDLFLSRNTYDQLVLELDTSATRSGGGVFPPPVKPAPKAGVDGQRVEIQAAIRVGTR